MNVNHRDTETQRKQTRPSCCRSLSSSLSLVACLLCASVSLWLDAVVGPRLALLAGELAVRLLVADKFLLRRVPRQLPPEPDRDPAQMTHRRRPVPDLDVADRGLPRFH